MNVYGMLKHPSLDDGFLYHFTKVDSLFKILENMNLRLSTFKNLNDLNEKEIKFSWQDWQNGLNVKNFIVEHCKLISFSQNFTRNKSQCQCGCNHPRMWAQYADDNKGACVVINESKFIETNKSILKNYFWKIESVNYLEHIYNDNSINITDSEKFVKENYQKLFFEKYMDWSQEDERRLFIIGEPDFLSIDNCIEFICLGNKFEKDSYTDLAEILISSTERGFKILTPHDFSFQLNADGRSLAMDNAGRIINYIYDKGDRNSKYISHLNRNGYNL
jgi:hypothetical protein